MTLGRDRAGTPARALPRATRRATRPVAARAAAAVAGAGLVLGASAGCGGAPSAVTTPDPVLTLLDVAWATPTSDVGRMEQIVAECMAAEGFAYTPTASVTTSGTGSGTTSGAGSTAGYGVTSGAHPGPPTADPNAAVVAALSPAEQQAYWTALDGARDEDGDGDGDDDTDGWQYDWRDAGCRGRAQNEVYGDPATLGDGAALEAELAEARLAAAYDPRVAELDASWATCMQAAGHPGLSAADDAPAAVREAWEALWADAWAGLPPDPAPSDVAAAEDAARPAVEALATQERALATADSACRAELGYDAARDAVAAEYRQRFYQGHRSALEAWSGGVSRADG